MSKFLVTSDDILTSDGKYPDRKALADANHILKSEILAKKVTELLELYGQRPKISSGFRDPITNTKIGGAKSSAHCSAEAVDFADKGLGVWCLKNVGTLARLGLYLENPAHTPTWCHLSTRKTKSGRIVFDP